MKRAKSKYLILFVIIMICYGCAPGAVERSGEPISYNYDQHVRLARDLERSGDLKGALDEWKVAKIIDPASAEAQDNIVRIGNLSTQEADKAFNDGVDAWNKGLYKAARRSFLIALRLDPDRKEALDKFFEQPPRPVGIVAHKVAPGETLSTIAKKYYSDSREYKLLIEYNKIDDPAKLKAGDEIFIPGVSPEEAASRQAESGGETPASEAPQAETTVESPAEQGASKTSAYNTAPQTPGTGNQLELYYLQGLNFYNKKEYGPASDEFLKILNADPSYKDTLNYYKDSAYQNGRIMLQTGHPEAAYTSFKRLSEIDPGYRDTRNYLSSAEAQTKELHYLKGIQLYNEEKLEEALKEWNIVYDLDPNYKKVSYYIERCQQVLKKIKELKSSDT